MTRGQTSINVNVCVCVCVCVCVRNIYEEFIGVSPHAFSSLHSFFPYGITDERTLTLTFSLCTFTLFIRLRLKLY